MVPLQDDKKNLSMFRDGGRSRGRRGGPEGKLFGADRRRIDVEWLMGSNGGDGYVGMWRAKITVADPK